MNINPKFNNFWAKLTNKNKSHSDKGKKLQVWSKKSKTSPTNKKQKISNKFLIVATKPKSKNYKIKLWKWRSTILKNHKII